MATPQNAQLTIVGTESKHDEKPIKIEDLRARRTDELIVAMVGPVGSGCSSSAKIIETLLKHDYAYEDVLYHKVSDLHRKERGPCGVVYG